MTKHTATRIEIAAGLKELRALPYFKSFGRGRLLRRPVLEKRLSLTPDNFNLAALVEKALGAADILDEADASFASGRAAQKTRVSRERSTMEIIRQFRVRTLYMPADDAIENDEPATFLELMFSAKASDSEYLERINTFLEKYKLDTYTA